MGGNTASKTSKQQSLRALIVDDSEDDALLIIRELKKGGYHPVYERVETAAAMKKALKDKTWDIILCDYKMPNFSAPAAIALLKKADINIPLIIISGAIGEDTAVECMRQGAQDYIMKSNLSRLCPAIARELNEADARGRQKRAEEEMYKLALIIHNASEMINLSTLDGNMVFLNEAGSRMLGISPDKVNQVNIMQIIPTHLKDMVKKKILPALLNKGKWSGDLQYMNIKTGQITDFHSTCFVIKDLKTDKPIYMANVSLEITERKKAEEKLRESEEKYRTILENMQEAYFEVDLSGNFTFFNDAVCRDFGYSRDELMGMNFRQYMDPDTAKKLFQAYHKVYTSGEPIKDLSWQITRKDGTKKYIEGSVSLKKDSSGKPIGFKGIDRDITERKLSEEALSESEKKLREAQEIANLGHWIWDVRSGKVEWSEEVFKIFQLDPNSFTPQIDSIQDLSPWPDDHERGRELIRKAIESHEGGSYEQRFLRPDKSIGYYFSSYQGKYDDHGNLISIVGTVQDITKSKLAEKKLRQSEEKYRTILGNIREAYFEVDLAGNLIFFNDSLCRITGFTREELAGKNYGKLSDQETIKNVFQTFNKVYKTGEPTEGFDWPIIRKDGSKGYVEASILLEKDSAGNPTGFKGMLRDISGRKQSDDALRASEELYTRLVNTIPDIIVRNDLAGKILFVNDYALRISGYKREEIEGKNLLSFFPPEEHERLTQDILLMMESKQDPREYNLIIKDGRKIPLEINGDVLRNEDGTPFGIVTVSRDISERKLTERALREKEERLRGITHNLPGIIYQFYAKDSGEFGMSYASERLTEIFGIEASTDTLFPLFLSHVHEEDRESFLTSIRKAVEAESPWNFEARVFTRDDKMIWFQGIATPTRHEDQLVFNGILLDTTERKQAEVKLQELLESLRKAFAATIQVMVSAVEMRDPYTAGHQARTADIARAIATEMGLDQDKIDGIRMAGTIHDIGKLSIPAEILSKPTKLTNLEFSLIKEHPKIGYEILKDIESPWPLAEIVYQHHERMDGSGYPRKLKGDAIIMEARIMAVADVVEAMASHRPYRAALGIEVALEEIEKNKGAFYDDTVVEACLRLFRDKGYKLPN